MVHAAAINNEHSHEVTSLLIRYTLGSHKYERKINSAFILCLL